VSVNLLGNCVATMVVARWEGQLDSARMSSVLRGEDIEPLEEADVEPQKEVVAAG
jgi:aerobic C4-dicarboxylate transport protein